MTCLGPQLALSKCEQGWAPPGDPLSPLGPRPRWLLQYSQITGYLPRLEERTGDTVAGQWARESLGELGRTRYRQSCSMSKDGPLLSTIPLDGPEGLSGSPCSAFSEPPSLFPVLADPPLLKKPPLAAWFLSGRRGCEEPPEHLTPLNLRKCSPIPLWLREARSP